MDKHYTVKTRYDLSDMRSLETQNTSMLLKIIGNDIENILLNRMLFINKRKFTQVEVIKITMIIYNKYHKKKNRKVLFFL